MQATCSGRLRSDAMARENRSCSPRGGEQLPGESRNASTGTACHDSHAHTPRSNRAAAYAFSPAIAPSLPSRPRSGETSLLARRIVGASGVGDPAAVSGDRLVHSDSKLSALRSSRRRPGSGPHRASGERPLAASLAATRLDFTAQAAATRDSTGGGVGAAATLPALARDFAGVASHLLDSAAWRRRDAQAVGARARAAGGEGAADDTEALLSDAPPPPLPSY